MTSARRKDFIAKLRKMRALIQRGWTQRYMARDALGRHTDPHNPDAVCWCIVGASDRVDMPPWALFDGRRRLLRAAWNDDPRRTKTEVIACIDNSIRALEAE